MSKRAALLAKLEHKFDADQLKTGILEHDGISVGQIPEFHPVRTRPIHATNRSRHSGSSLKNDSSQACLPTNQRH
jgi:hypothetical protein